MRLLAESGNQGLGTWPMRRARIDPDAPALTQGGRRVTYAVLADRTARLAAALRGLGIGPGDRVAHLGGNDIAVFELCFAAGWLGAVFVPLNTRLAEPEVRYALEDSGAAVVVVADDGPVAAAVLADAGTATAVDRACFDELVTTHEPLPEPAPIALEDPALLLYTSGTTGRPKAAVLTHAAITWNTVNQLAHLDLLSTDRALCLAPLFHAVGFGQVTLPLFLKGGRIEIAEAFDAGRMLRMIEQERITCFAAVPTILQLLTEHPDWEGADLSSLRLVVYGGSPAVDRVVRAWQERGVTLQQGYGMTEAAPGVLMASAAGGGDKHLSAGVPHFFTDVAHLAEDGVRPVSGEPRELLVRGPHVFAGYLGREEESAREVVDGEWFRTGDVVRFDDDGWGFVVDRTKDVIISGAENVYPAEVEAVLMEAPGVRSAAVVGAPDDRWGEVGVAYVEPLPGHDVDLDALREHLTSRLARFKVPARLHLVPDLPRNATGKVQRHVLRRQAGTPSESTDPSDPEAPSR